MAKIGRPKKESPKLKSITIRLSDSEYEKFIKYAASHNMTMTQALLKGIIIPESVMLEVLQNLFPLMKEQRWQKQEKIIRAGL